MILIHIIQHIKIIQYKANTEEYRIILLERIKRVPQFSSITLNTSVYFFLSLSVCNVNTGSLLDMYLFSSCFMHMQSNIRQQ